MNKKRFFILIAGLITIGIAGFFTFQIVNADPLLEKLEQAKEAYNNDKIEESITLFEEALELDPGHTEARVGLANAYLAIEKSDEAIEILDEGIDLKPKEPQFYYTLSIAYNLADDLPNVIGTLEKGIELTQNTALEVLYEKTIENVQIEVDRHYVQVDHSRDLSLIWEKDNGDKIPVEAEWEINDTSLGEIKTANESAVTFTGNNLGDVVVSATVGSVTKDAELFVEEQVIEEIVLYPAEIDPLSVGEELNLSVTGFDADGEEMEFSPLWSDSEEIIEFTQTEGRNNTLTAVMQGITNVTIAYQELEEEVELTIEGVNKIVQAGVEGEGIVSISPDEPSYPVGSEIQLTATPNPGYEFVRWEGDISGEMNPYVLTVEDNMSVVAVFERSTHELRLSTSGEGTIIRNSLDTTYNHLDSIALTARPSDGWTFERWEGDVSGTNPNITVLMDDDKAIRAVFTKDSEPAEDTTEETDKQPEQEPENKPEQKEPDPEPEPEPEPDPTFSLSTSVSGSGQIQKDKSGSSFTKGTVVNITAVPSNGWKFVRWQGDASGTSPSASITMNGNKSVVAVFEKVPVNYTLSTSVKGEGTVYPASGTYNEGASVTIEAIPAVGWTFSHWEGDLSGSSLVTRLTMNGNRHVTAVFVKESE